MMRKRFIWSIIFCLAIAIVLIPINLQLINESIGNADGARRLNFFSLMFVELLLLFILIFNIVDTYYTVHHEEGLLFTDKLMKDPNIPPKYKGMGGTGGQGGPGGPGSPSGAGGVGGVGGQGGSG